MADMHALAILKKQTDSIKQLPQPPDDNDDIATYEHKIKQEERRLQEELEKKLEEEKRERERLLDPNTWTSIRYSRPCDQVDGRRRFHDDLGCIFSSPKSGLKREHFVCEPTDELDSVVNILEDGEKFASSLINLQSNVGSIEVPSRVFIPSVPIEHSHCEVVIKYSVDGKDWVTSHSVQPTENIATEVDEGRASASNLIGIELDNFKTIKACAVVRPKRQTISVDSTGTTCSSETDANVMLVIPKDAFNSDSQAHLSVQLVPSVPNMPKVVSSCSPFVTLSCQTQPANKLEVHISVHEQKGPKQTKQDHYTGLCFKKGGSWTHANVSYKMDQPNKRVVVLDLPPGMTLYKVVAFQIPPNMLEEKQIENAQLIYNHVHGTPVQVILRQNKDKPTEAALVIDKTANITATIKRLELEGYTLCRNISNIHFLKEGQQLLLSFSGNVDVVNITDVKTMRFYEYTSPIWKTLSLSVKGNEKTDPVGKIAITVDDGKELPTEAINFCIRLPKIRKK